MNVHGMTLAHLGDSALVLSWGEEVDESALAHVRAVSDALQRAALAGVVEVVPAFASVTVFYDIVHTGVYDVFEARVVEIAGRAEESTLRAAAARVVEIPVCYGGEYGPDLELVAGRARVGLDKVIEWHSDAEYRVHAIGFVPGFGYLGGLHRKLQTERRPTPRPSVPPGSVGIGGAQTGIYPLVTPGGWNLIGRTPLTMFDVSRPEPAILRAGDRVKFRPISPEEFTAWK
jgi:inhibitor of KinA